MPGQLEAIWIKRAKLGPMDPVESAELVVDRGLVGNANQGGRRQVTIIDVDAWERATAQTGEAVEAAARRANLLVKGIELAQSRGKVLKIGDCRLAIWGETVPCERMDEACDGLRVALEPEWRGGAFGSVLEGGAISVGDSVEWEVTPSQNPPVHANI
jgi:MOSC domain-containing protein YiiM